MTHTPPPRDDGRDPRVPMHNSALLAGLLLAAAVPIALLVLSAPAIALGSFGFVLGVALSVRLLARALRSRLRGRHASVHLPGLDLRVEVGLSSVNGDH